ncbi:helix-turn-helix domain-containing protein [Brevibacterium metallidurans]|uniref:Helix-turn-helix domain-containing protein n=2 Tax=Brevibacterium metallidurans TaxID=1482676 RepID=A0ABN0SQ76_9MICO
MTSLPTVVSGAKSRISPFHYINWHRAVTNLKAEHLRATAKAHGSSPTMMKLVAMLVSDYSDKFGRKAFPGHERLMSHAGCKEEALRKALRALEDFGLLTCVSPGRPGWNAEYWLTLPSEIATELHNSWGNWLLERRRDLKDAQSDPLSREGSPLVRGDATLNQEGSAPPPGGSLPLHREGPPNPHQTNDQTTHHRARKRAGGASRDVAEVASAADCTQAEAVAMIERATADPTTTRSASGRLLSDPAYRARVLYGVRDRAGQQAREERGEITRLLRTLPREVAECAHGQQDGLAPNRNDEPMCPQCRRTPGVEALTLADAMQLGMGPGAA